MQDCRGAVVCSYWDQSKVEVNIAKQKNPLIGKIVSCARMVGPSAPGETCNIVIDHQGKFS
jgi:ferredoxin--NADP+ reductase